MGLERYEWRSFSTEHPKAIIRDLEPWGWRVYSIHNRERVVRTNYESHRQDYGHYEGTTTYDREKWTDLIMVRDPRHPHYARLVELEKIWRIPDPPRPWTPPPEEPTKLRDVFLGLSMMVFLPLWLVFLPLLFWDRFNAFVQSIGLLQAHGILGAFSLASGGALTIWVKDAVNKPGEEKGPDLTEYNRTCIALMKRRDAALAEATTLLARTKP